MVKKFGYLFRSVCLAIPVPWRLVVPLDYLCSCSDHLLFRICAEWIYTMHAILVHWILINIAVHVYSWVGGGWEWNQVDFAVSELMCDIFHMCSADTHLFLHIMQYIIRFCIRFVMKKLFETEITILYGICRKMNIEGVENKAGYPSCGQGQWWRRSLGHLGRSSKLGI